MNEVKTEIHNAENLNPLAQHVRRFTDKNGFFSAQTVGDGLKRLHSNYPHLKGKAIAEFNNVHSGGCPFFPRQFAKDPKTGYAKYLHLGTMRIWTVDGTIDEEHWAQFVSAVTQGQEQNETKIVTKSAVKAYLDECYKNDPQEETTGRNSNSIFSSSKVQSVAAIQAWKEVFDRLACGWVFNKQDNEYEPYINLDLVRLFFEDSDRAFEKAEKGELPKATASY